MNKNLKEYSKYTWNTHGKKHTPDKMKYLELGEISTPHLKAIIATQRQILGTYVIAINAILSHRKELGVLDIPLELLRAKKRNKVPWIATGSTDLTEIFNPTEFIAPEYKSDGLYRCSCKKSLAFYTVIKESPVYGVPGRKFCKNCLFNLEEKFIYRVAIDDLPLYIGFDFFSKNMVINILKQRLEKNI